MAALSPLRVVVSDQTIGLVVAWRVRRVRTPGLSRPAELARGRKGSPEIDEIGRAHV